MGRGLITTRPRSGTAQKGACNNKIYTYYVFTYQEKMGSTPACNHTLLLHMKLKANPSHRMFLRPRKVRVCTVSRVSQQQQPHVSRCRSSGNHDSEHGDFCLMNRALNCARDDILRWTMQHSAPGRYYACLGSASSPRVLLEPVSYFPSSSIQVLPCPPMSRKSHFALRFWLESL